MSNRTWVCIECGKSYRRNQAVESVQCAICRKKCEYVHWKIHIPSPKKTKEWQRFWALYKKEKKLIAIWIDDKSIKEINLNLLNKKMIKGKYCGELFRT
ncbi:MAG: hypothetical protein HY811_03995 [Planctomycetes bacterium]|nr:hypothetical protein [Planctomycetota bacterium]